MARTSDTTAQPGLTKPRPPVMLGFDVSLMLAINTQRRVRSDMKYEELITEAKKVTGEFKLSTDWLSAGSCGAALLAANKKIYTGICIDLGSGIGFCAEHSAIAQMLKDRETRIIAVVATCEDGIVPPCGRCREMMKQIDRGNADADVVITEDRTEKLHTLLPEHWL